MPPRKKHPWFTILDMQKLAKKSDGLCLSKEYINSRTKLTWQCKEGHQWEAIPNSVKQGHWCPFCAGVRKGAIEEMQEIARDRGGQCLSPKYINSSTKLRWQCKQGHQWEAVPGSIKQGTWCLTCTGLKKGTIDEMRIIAESKGGKYVSGKYINNDHKLTFRCKEGHQWLAAPRGIKLGRWCPVCARKK